MRKVLLTLMAVCLITCAYGAKSNNVGVNQRQKVDSLIENISKDINAIKKFQDSVERARTEAWEKFKQREVQPEQPASKETMSTEYGAMLQVANNTAKDWDNDGWNRYGWVTLVVALFSLVIALGTLLAQFKTERHTMKAPINVQKSKLEDLPRHFYRNLVCTVALIFKYQAQGEEKTRPAYPSENHLLKLKALPDDIMLPIDVKKESYGKMHEIKLLLRNYNVEVEVARDHLMRQSISDDTLKQDFDNLLFKPLFLTQNTFKFEKSLPGSAKEDLVLRTIIVIVAEHFKKLKKASNFNLLADENGQKLLENVNLESFIKEVDKKGSVDRSVNSLLDYVFDKSKDNEKTGDGIVYKKKEKRIEVSRLKMMEAVKEILKEDVNDVYLNAIVELGTNGDFISFYQKNYPADDNDANAKTVDPRMLYGYLQPYLDYLRVGEDGGKTWEFHRLLKHMLIVDAAIEVNRIGMVNFS